MIRAAFGAMVGSDSRGAKVSAAAATSCAVTLPHDSVFAFMFVRPFRQPSTKPPPQPLADRGGRLNVRMPRR